MLIPNPAHSIIDIGTACSVIDVACSVCSHQTLQPVKFVEPAELYSPTQPILPPRFLFTDDDGNVHPERETEVIEENYNELVSLLQNGEGYETLLAIKKRLEESAQSSEAEAAESESRFNYLQSQLYGIQRRVVKIANSEASDKQDLNSVRDHILERPMGEHWRSEDGKFRHESKTGEWSVYTDQAEDHNRTCKATTELSELRITYTPQSGQWGYEFNSDYLTQYETVICGGYETWQEVIDLLKRRLQNQEHEYDQKRRARDYLLFRISVLDRVLYRFEAFGSVEPMEKEAKRQSLETLPDIFEGRRTLLRHAEKVVEKYRAEPKSLPETMSDLKAWIGRDGENAVTQLQSAIREADLAHRYKDGHPESFCELVEDLVCQSIKE